MKIIRSIKIIFFILPAVFSVQCGNMLDDFFNDPENTGTAQWATPVKSADDECVFNAVAVDSEGNAYAVGTMKGNGTYDFGGNSSGVSGKRELATGAVIVKYNQAGTAQWAKTIESASGKSEFKGVGIDDSGNVYVVGEVEGYYTDTLFDFGGNAGPVSVHDTGKRSVIVKYNSAGVAQWAVPVVSAPNTSSFSGVAVDAAGNSYAVGYVGQLDKFGYGSYSFGGLSKPFPGVPDQSSAVIVKYNSSGEAQWVTPVKATTEVGCEFLSVAVDRSGNAYAVGTMHDTGNVYFDTDIRVNGLKTGSNSAVIVKYNAEGIVQWATPVKKGNDGSEFHGVAVDRSGNAYAVGFVFGNNEYNFGGASNSLSGKCDTQNSVIVKYNSSGMAQWATTISDSSSSASCSFNGAAVDVEGNIYAVGYVVSNSLFDFGGNSTPFNASYKIENTVIVKYDSSGTAQWATPIKEAASCSFFTGVAVNGSGYAFAVGYVGINRYEAYEGLYNFGGKSVPYKGPSINSNTVIVKYY